MHTKETVLLNLIVIVFINLAIARWLLAGGDYDFVDSTGESRDKFRRFRCYSCYRSEIKERETERSNVGTC